MKYTVKFILEIDEDVGMGENQIELILQTAIDSIDVEMKDFRLIDVCE
jgi:hypothetical protein